MWSRRSAGFAAALGALWLAGGAAAEEPREEWPLNVIILQTSNEEGEVDPRAREIDEKLKRKIRYNSLRVLSEERVNLHADEVGTIELPDGRAVRVQPVHKGKKGLLMGIDVEGSVKLDARARKGHHLLIGAGEYQDGNLAVSIEPDYEEEEGEGD